MNDYQVLDHSFKVVQTITGVTDIKQNNGLLTFYTGTVVKAIIRKDAIGGVVVVAQ